MQPFASIRLRLTLWVVMKKYKIQNCDSFCTSVSKQGNNVISGVYDCHPSIYSFLYHDYSKSCGFSFVKCLEKLGLGIRNSSLDLVSDPGFFSCIRRPLASLCSIDIHLMVPCHRFELFECLLVLQSYVFSIHFKVLSLVLRIKIKEHSEYENVCSTK